MRTGAGVIATACPYCIRQLHSAIAKLGVGNKIKVQDITELLSQSVDLSDKSGKTGNSNRSVSQEGLHV
jgi:Fe-S oxidoreductase